MDPQEAKPDDTRALHRSWAFLATAAVAVAAIAATIGLAVWGGQSTRVVSVVVAVRPSGRVTLLITNLAPAPPGKTYEAWIVSNGRISPAGLFDGGRGTRLIHLPGRLSHGGRVVATLERSGGLKTPTHYWNGKTVFDVTI